jgi:hypothetical protein
MNNTPTEDQECHTLVDYLEILKQQGKVIVFSHTANETYTKSWKQKARNKRMGVRSGVPDYIIVTKKHTIFLEMKRTKGGVVSATQKEWVKAIQDTGVACEVCRGFDEAKEFLDSYL